MIEILSVHGLPATHARSLLEALPDWFGRPEAIAAYAAEAVRLTCIAVREDGRLIGFASLKPLTLATCEIACMGLGARWHGLGHGRRMMEAALRWMEEQRFSLALVRTLGPSDPDPHYARTRAFYSAAGFLPLIEIAEHFGPGTPALLMVRPLTPRS